MRNLLRRTRFTIARLAAAIALIAATVGVIMPSPANAAADWTWPLQASNVWTNGWANVRSCDRTTCSVVFQLYGPAYSPVDMLCWEDGQWANGNYYTNRWFYIYSLTARRYGYINASLVYNQVKVGSC